MKASGSFFYQMKKYLLERYDESKWNEFLDNLDNESKEFFKTAILSGEKYDVIHVQRGFKVYEKMFGQDELIRLADFVAHKEMKGVLGLMFRFMSYETFLQKLPTYIKKLYDHGDVEYEKIDDKRYILHFSDFTTTELHLFFMSVLFRRYVELISKRRFKESINKIDDTHVDFILVRNV